MKYLVLKDYENYRSCSIKEIGDVEAKRLLEKKIIQELPEVSKKKESEKISKKDK